MAIEPQSKLWHKSCICALVNLTAKVTKAPARFSQQQLFAVKTCLPTHPKRQLLSDNEE